MNTFTTEPTTTETLPPAPLATIHQDPATEADREAAFSDEYFWNETQLLPFSLERYNIFVTQRLAMCAPTLGAALQDGAAFFPDALRLLWLCSTPPETLSRLRSRPQDMQAAIEAWAADNAPVSRSTEVLDIGLKLFNSAFENRHESRPTRGGARSSSGN